MRQEDACERFEKSIANNGKPTALYGERSKKEPYRCLMPEMPLGEDPLSLSQLLERTPEPLRGEMPPALMCLHLSRVSQQGKNQSEVDLGTNLATCFPVQFEKDNGERQEHTSTIVSCACHEGNTENNGHYGAYLMEDNKLWECDSQEKAVEVLHEEKWPFIQANVALICAAHCGWSAE